ncbi:CPBP family intramembrane glutamic endopeptidase [Pseudoalteromonas sp. G4]|uniref:CPBP family intramembrane glutamic endopeptidase n=1 Tax=Pseudoalteromonas sp. G4 TaxID=2992761 RepID=UPI00237EA182|nr:CPBP family intramembrane glutamic endopeptidase [Pseudoalteromonas sp. G4]MDE3274305.1 CPBP family intramembrane metalloprotease [Pseudoalteromonas sp. G4]
MNSKKEAYITIITFLILTVAFYILGYWLIYRMGRATPLMLSVGAATIATCLIRRKSLATLGWSWGSWNVQWQSYLIPLFITCVAYVTIWSLGLAELDSSKFLSDKKESYNLQEWGNFSLLAFHFFFIAIIGFVMAIPSILGEEIAWRGLLVPELSKVTSFTGVALVSGILWSAFHWPIIFLGLYGNGDTSIYYQLFFFTLFLTSSGTIMAYYRLKSGSVWTAVMYHGTLNIFLQKLFAPITINGENSNYYVDEFGAVLALVASFVAYFYWKKGVREFTPLSR